MSFVASAGNGITCTSGSWDCEISGVEDDYDASVERFNYALSRLERIQAIAPLNDTLAVSVLNLALEDLEAARIALDAGQNATGAMFINAAEQHLDEIDG
ncbi:hypothetical protein GF325_16890, partial [Candidatus Bathyarchaeota archaeon]|nr:hypothetical protein [Candidatus Bathyarchaeota archaeon]